MKKLFLANRINVLEVIAEKGHYKNRIQIVNNMNLLIIKNQWSLIKILIDDKIVNISKDVIRIYENSYLPNEIKISIQEKKTYWKDKKIEDKRKQKRISELLKNTNLNKRKFGNGDTYQKVKLMLKKPLNVGKWF